MAKLLVRLGKRLDKKVACVITNMNEPLGYAIGNFTEVWESCEVLKGRGPKDLREISDAINDNYEAAYDIFMK